MPQAISKYRTDLQGDHVFDYKDPIQLMRFISEGGKIAPSRMSRLSIAQQRRLTVAVKRARHLALLPIGAKASDHFGRANPISPQPFDL